MKDSWSVLRSRKGAERFDKRTELVRRRHRLGAGQAAHQTRFSDGRKPAAKGQLYQLSAGLARGRSRCAHESDTRDTPGAMTRSKGGQPGRVGRRSPALGTTQLFQMELMIDSRPCHVETESTASASRGRGQQLSLEFRKLGLQLTQVVRRRLCSIDRCKSAFRDLCV